MLYLTTWTPTPSTMVRHLPLLHDKLNIVAWPPRITSYLGQDRTIEPRLDRAYYLVAMYHSLFSSYKRVR